MCMCCMSTTEEARHQMENLKNTGIECEFQLAVVLFAVTDLRLLTL